MCIGYLHLDATEEKMEAPKLQVADQEQQNQKYYSRHFLLSELSFTFALCKSKW